MRVDESPWREHVNKQNNGPWDTMTCRYMATGEKEQPQQENVSERKALWNATAKLSKIRKDK